VYTVAQTLAVAIVGLRAVIERRNRVAWSMVTAGVAANTLANAIYTFHDQNLDTLPSPAPSDYPYLAFYVLLAIALVALTQRGRGVVDRSTMLDGVITGLGVAAVAVALWFEPILDQSGNLAAVVVAVAYPLLDVVMIVTLVAGLAPQRYRPTWSMSFLMAGIALFLLGDVVYLNQIAANTYVVNTGMDATWAIGIVLIAVAAWCPSDHRREHRSRPATGLTAIPTGVGVLALGVLAFAVAGRGTALASALAVVTLALVLLRTLMTVRDLRSAHVSHLEARTDDLTGLANRRAFSERLDAATTEPVRGRLSVLVVDLDGFKEVNDSLGHPVGDDLLRQVSHRFDRCLPRGTALARIGGDEFGILHPQTDGLELAGRLIGTLASPFTVDGVAIRVGASVGVAHWPDHGRTRADLLRAADVAMYLAKRRGTGPVTYATEDDPHSREALALVEDLHVAIENRDLDLHYQPVINVRTNAVVGIEALARWIHPTRGRIEPDQFIPLAEQSGKIGKLTRAVIEVGVSDLARLRANGFDLDLSINISGHDLVDEHLTHYVVDTLHAYRTPTSTLILEITETALAADHERAERTVRQLRERGIRIAIDDFGVGYSSMSQLLEMPFDELKVDRRFVSTDGSAKARAILGATAAVGRALGVEVVAEGIETEADMNLVVATRADKAQGFLISPALPIHELQRFLILRAETIRPLPGTPLLPGVPRRPRPRSAPTVPAVLSPTARPGRSITPVPP